MGYISYFARCHADVGRHSDFLYGKPGGEELGTVFDDLKRYDALVKLDEAAWTTILKRCVFLGLRHSDLGSKWEAL